MRKSHLALAQVLALAAVGAVHAAVLAPSNLTSSSPAGAQVAGNVTASSTGNPSTAGNASTLAPSNLTSGSVAPGQVTSSSPDTATAPGSSSVLTPGSTTSTRIAGEPVTPGTGASIIGVRPVEVGAADLVAAPVGLASGGVGGNIVVGANGERIPVVAAAVASSEPEVTVRSPEFDRATLKAERRLLARTSRQQQLLHSIAPRTNNDRSDQMPDDPIAPYLR